MENDSEVIQETPDMEFSENMMEQETPDINFDTEETPDIDFSELRTDTANKSLERFIAEESDFDDLDEPDQYVERDVDADDTNQSGTNNNHSESGRQSLHFSLLNLMLFEYSKPGQFCFFYSFSYIRQTQE